MGLHQDTQIGSVDITDTWEPLEEGLNRLETTRHVSVITIKLSTAPLDSTSVGYQACSLLYRLALLPRPDQPCSAANMCTAYRWQFYQCECACQAQRACCAPLTSTCAPSGSH